MSAKRQPLQFAWSLAVAMILGACWLLPPVAHAFLLPSGGAPKTVCGNLQRVTTTTTGVTPLAVASTPVPPAASAAGAAARRPRREVKVLQVVESPGGYMAKVQVNNFNEQSSHTVVTSKDLLAETCALSGLAACNVEDYFKAVFKFAMARGLPLQNTEGMLTAELFPINYFSVSQLSLYLEGCTEGIAEILKDT